MSLQLPYERLLRECGSKHLALYRAIRDGIAAGRLRPGERLPSTRRLAGLYGVSRGSVSLAYEMLAAEGYVRTGIGQGTFVAAEAGMAPGPAAATAAAGGAAGEPQRPEPAALSAWGRRVVRCGAPPARGGGLAEPDAGAAAGALSFVPRGIGERWFPWMEWRAAVAAQWRKLGERGEAAAAAEGSWRLRQAIALRLRRERGIVCAVEDVVVTAGSMQAIALLAQLLLEEGRTAVVENPCYPGTRQAVRATGAALAGARVDEQGIVPADWDARLLFVTPTRQFPTGAVLKLERRLELLAWAARRRAWIVEDDYDSDFRWGGRPIEPLKSLDRDGRVVYVGSFSRSMRTEVRIGYAVLPRSLREPFVRAKRLYAPHPEGIAEQQALAEWMAEGGYDRHLRRARRSFHRLQQRLRSGLGGGLGALFEVAPADAGLFLFARWRGEPADYARLARRCRELGVCWGDGRPYDAEADGEASGDGEVSMDEGADTNGEASAGEGVDANGEGSASGGMNTNEGANADAACIPAPSALFGFAHLDEEQIMEGLDRIGRAAESLGLIRRSRTAKGGTNG